MSDKLPVLLAGGTGYIASHTAISLLEAGFQPVLFDNLSNSSSVVLSRIESITGTRPPFIKGDVRDLPLVERVLKEYDIQAVIHFAALKAVGESVAKPLLYYQNNLSGSLILLEAMDNLGVKTLVFSSSATVYGEPKTVPITEDSEVGRAIANPYGRSKFMLEEVLKDLSHADSSWNLSILRYFNPVGGHESGLMGEDPKGTPSNLTPYLAQVAVGRQKELSVYGSDYPTKDGTGVRDYIHVMDVAEGHVAALSYLLAHKGLHIHNLGTGQGYSVLEVIRAFNEASGKAIPYSLKPRRPGDIAACWADTKKAETELQFHAKRDLHTMMRDLWHFQSQNKEGYHQTKD